MPKGNPKPETIATEKYRKKVGIISKSYKMQKDVVDEFAEACEKAGTHQSTQLTKMMKEFCEKVKEEIE